MRTPSLRTAAVLLCAALAGLRGQAQELPADERQIVRHVGAHLEDAIALLERVVNIDSRTENLAGVEQVALVFKQELEALGLTSTWIRMPPEMNRAGHLLAETRGTRGKRLLLLGHVDTVLSGEKFRREGDRAYGSGTSDMKAGVVLMLQALKAVHAAGALQDARIVVLLTGDEESVGRPLEISRGAMIAAAERSDAALSFEATVRNTATIGRRGSSFWSLEVTGRTGHSSLIFREPIGSGAIFEAARILERFYDELHAERYLTFNPSVIVGGSQAELDGASGTATGKTNVVPARVVVAGDLRFISEEQKQSARDRMRRIAAESLPGSSAAITFGDGYPAMTPSPASEALLAQLNRVSLDLGFGPVAALDPAERGAGDISFVSHLVPGLDGIGSAEGGNEHAPGEWTDLAPLSMLIQRAAVLIYRLTR